ncbi:hypothetical protein, partial [Pseudomonas capsici]
MTGGQAQGAQAAGTPTSPIPPAQVQAQRPVTGNHPLIRPAPTRTHQRTRRQQLAARGLVEGAD